MKIKLKAKRAVGVASDHNARCTVVGLRIRITTLERAVNTLIMDGSELKLVSLDRHRALNSGAAQTYKCVCGPQRKNTNNRKKSEMKPSGGVEGLTAI